MTWFVIREHMSCGLRSIVDRRDFRSHCSRTYHARNKLNNYSSSVFMAFHCLCLHICSIRFFSFRSRQLLPNCAYTIARAICLSVGLRLMKQYSVNTGAQMFPHKLQIFCHSNLACIHFQKLGRISTPERHPKREMRQLAAFFIRKVFQRGISAKNIQN